MTDVGYPIRIRVNGNKLYARSIAPAFLSDIDTLPSFRGEDMPLTGIHGRQFLDKLRDNRIWKMELYVLSDDATGTQNGTAPEQARTNLDWLLGILGADGQQLIERDMPDGSTRWCYAQTSAENATDKVGDQGLFQLTATFDMADPRWYGVDVVDNARSFAASPTSFSMSIGGTVRTGRVKCDVVGPSTGIRITNNTTGEWIEFTAGVVASSKHLLLDSYEWTGTNDGVDVQAQLQHSQQTVVFLEADPGTNSFTITGSAHGGTVTTTVTPAYW